MSWDDSTASKLANRLASASSERPTWLSAIVASALGVGIWAYVGFFSTGAEPWDTSRWLYIAWQGVGGILLGILWPRSFAWSWLFFLVGQVAAVLVGPEHQAPGVNLFFPLGLGFLVIFSFPCLAALWIGSAVRRTELWRRS